MGTGSNFRNGITTHPRKRARRERALDRFTVKESREPEYHQRKAVELASLKKSLGVA